MLANFAAGTLIVLGALLTVLGFIAGGGNVTFTLIGLGAIAVGGILGLLERRRGA
jgi:1,4-dihydroxy-2-naphthoate octaprenyltransferase